MRVFSKSDVGLVRKSNEDACRCGTFSDHAGWAVVCDGMGGVNGGNVASSVAVENISQAILSGYREGMDGEQIREMIASAISGANGTVHSLAGADASLAGMGTTVVAVILANGTAHVAHAGDSRAYLISHEDIRQLTTDHSMVQEMVEKGDLTAQEAKTHPQKNIITRALGVESSIRVDFSEIPVGGGDRLLICTDGLTNYLDEDQIFRFSQELGAQELTERLVALAKSAGGGDNITVVVLEDQAV